MWVIWNASHVYRVYTRANNALDEHLQKLNDPTIFLLEVDRNQKKRPEYLSCIILPFNVFVEKSYLICVPVDRTIQL